MMQSGQSRRKLEEGRLSLLRLQLDRHTEHQRESTHLAHQYLYLRFQQVQSVVFFHCSFFVHCNGQLVVIIRMDDDHHLLIHLIHVTTPTTIRSMTIMPKIGALVLLRSYWTPEAIIESNTRLLITSRQCRNIERSNRSIILASHFRFMYIL